MVAIGATFYNLKPEVDFGVRKSNHRFCFFGIEAVKVVLVAQFSKKKVLCLAVYSFFFSIFVLPNLKMK